MPTSGDTVRFTRGPLGLITHIDAIHTEPEVVRTGDTGTYSGRHPGRESIPAFGDWHVVLVAVRSGVNGDGPCRGLLCVCHESMFEFITDEGGE